MTDLPEAPWPPLSRFSRVLRASPVSVRDAGPLDRRAAEFGGGALPESQDVRKVTTGTAMHDADPGQEAGYNLLVNGKSGRAVGGCPSVFR